MNVVVILVALLGQCGPRGCPAPPSQSSAYVMKVHSVTHEGLTYNVKGWKRDDGKISWFPTEPFNVQSLQDAKRLQAERKPQADDKDEVVPSAKIGPPPKRRAVGDAPIFGVEPSKMIRKGESYKATTPEAKRFVEEAISSGDTEGKTLHVTLIGPESETAKVINDINTHSAFDGIRQKFMIQDYRPGEWQVDPSLGFKGDGKPSILVQSAKSEADPKGGKVLLRSNDYSMGPEALAQAIRKADPGYDSSKDPIFPIPSLKSLCPLGFTSEHWPHVIAVAIGVMFLHRLPRKGP